MPLPYPQKQTLAVAVICILVVGGAAAYVFGKSGPKQAQEAVVAIPATTTSSLADTASSSDWQRDFFLTAIGTSSLSTGSVEAKTAPTGPLTLTDQMSREFFARYIQLKQNNLDNNPQLVQDTIDQTLDNAASAAKQPEKYAMSDISVSKDSSSASIHAYGNAVGSVFGKYGPTRTPADIATEAFDKDDLTILTQIDPIIASLNKINSILVVTPVPLPLVQYHLDLINAVNSMVYVSQGLRNIQSDPMQAIVALGAYAQAQTDATNALTSLQTYFKSNAISFSPSEPGYLLIAITFPTT